MFFWDRGGRPIVGRFDVLAYDVGFAYPASLAVWDDNRDFVAGCFESLDEREDVG